jgi:hypothetical protein
MVWIRPCQRLQGAARPSGQVFGDDRFPASASSPHIPQLDQFVVPVHVPVQ